MNITITQEQYEKLRRLSDFADFYIDDMEPSNSCYNDDKEDITQAQEVIQDIEALILGLEYTCPKFEPAQEES